MRKILYFWIVTVGLLSTIGGCGKEKTNQNNPPPPVVTSCTGKPFQIAPFIENNQFYCNDTIEYTFIYRKKAQIDSLFPNCSFAAPVGFPFHENNFVYIMLGRTTYHYRDTFETKLWKDTCLNTLVYEVNMIQTDTAFNRGGSGEILYGVIPLFCEIPNIPSNYQVSVKYKYVPK